MTGCFDPIRAELGATGGRARPHHPRAVRREPGGRRVGRILAREKQRQADAQAGAPGGPAGGFGGAGGGGGFAGGGGGFAGQPGAGLVAGGFGAGVPLAGAPGAGLPAPAGPWVQPPGGPRVAPNGVWVGNLNGGGGGGVPIVGAPGGGLPAPAAAAMGGPAPMAALPPPGGGGLAMGPQIGQFAGQQIFAPAAGGAGGGGAAPAVAGGGIPITPTPIPGAPPPGPEFGGGLTAAGGMAATAGLDAVRRLRDAEIQSQREAAQRFDDVNALAARAREANREIAALRGLPNTAQTAAQLAQEAGNVGIGEAEWRSFQTGYQAYAGQYVGTKISAEQSDELQRRVAGFAVGSRGWNGADASRLLGTIISKSAPGASTDEIMGQYGQLAQVMQLAPGYTGPLLGQLSEVVGEAVGPNGEFGDALDAAVLLRGVSERNPRTASAYTRAVLRGLRRVRGNEGMMQELGITRGMDTFEQLEAVQRAADRATARGEDEGQFLESHGFSEIRMYGGIRTALDSGLRGGGFARAGRRRATGRRGPGACAMRRARTGPARRGPISVSRMSGSRPPMAPRPAGRNGPGSAATPIPRSRRPASSTARKARSTPSPRRSRRRCTAAGGRRNRTPWRWTSSAAASRPRRRGGATWRSRTASKDSSTSGMTRPRAMSICATTGAAAARSRSSARWRRSSGTSARTGSGRRGARAAAAGAANTSPATPRPAPACSGRRSSRCPTPATEDDHALHVQRRRAGGGDPAGRRPPRRRGRRPDRRRAGRADPPPLPRRHGPRRQILAR